MHSAVLLTQRGAQSAYAKKKAAQSKLKGAAALQQKVRSALCLACVLLWELSLDAEGKGAATAVKALCYGP